MHQRDSLGEGDKGSKGYDTKRIVRAAIIGCPISDAGHDELGLRVRD